LGEVHALLWQKAFLWLPLLKNGGTGETRLTIIQWVFCAMCRGRFQTCPPCLLNLIHLVGYRVQWSWDCRGFYRFGGYGMRRDLHSGRVWNPPLQVCTTRNVITNHPHIRYNQSIFKETNNAPIKHSPQNRYNQYNFSAIKNS